MIHPWWVANLLYFVSGLLLGASAAGVLAIRRLRDLQWQFERLTENYERMLVNMDKIKAEWEATFKAGHE